MRSCLYMMCCLLVATAWAAEAVTPPPACEAPTDGEADAAPAIQKALDEAAALRSPVFLRPGSYRIGTTLNVPPGITLSGLSPRWEDSSPVRR